MHQKTPKQLVNSGLKFQALEPRIMFDGAAVFTGAEALEQLENQSTSQIQNDINENNSVEILLKNKVFSLTYCIDTLKQTQDGHSADTVLFTLFMYLM